MSVGNNQRCMSSELISGKFELGIFITWIHVHFSASSCNPFCVSVDMFPTLTGWYNLPILMTRQTVGWMTDELEFSSQHGPRFYLFSTAFRLVLKPTQPSLQWAQGLPQGWSIQVMKLSTRLHLAPRLKTHRTILPLFYTSSCYDVSLSIATTTLPSSSCSPALFFMSSLTLLYHIAFKQVSYWTSIISQADIGLLLSSIWNTHHCHSI